MKFQSRITRTWKQNPEVCVDAYYSEKIIPKHGKELKDKAFPRWSMETTTKRFRTYGFIWYIPFISSFSFSLLFSTPAFHLSFSLTRNGCFNFHLRPFVVSLLVTRRGNIVTGQKCKRCPRDCFIWNKVTNNARQRLPMAVLMFRPTRNRGLQIKTRHNDKVKVWL